MGKNHSVSREVNINLQSKVTGTVLLVATVQQNAFSKNKQNLKKKIRKKINKTLHFVALPVPKRC